jgi:hypothetical protein
MRRPARIAHHLPRRKHQAARTRLRVSPKAVHKVADRIHQLSDVTCVETNETTGSILVHHQNSMQDLIATLEAQGICELTGLPEPASELLAGLGPKVLSVALAVAVLAVIGPSWTSWIEA